MELLLKTDSNEMLVGREMIFYHIKPDLSFSFSSCGKPVVLHHPPLLDNPELRVQRAGYKTEMGLMLGSDWLILFLTSW